MWAHGVMALSMAAAAGLVLPLKNARTFSRIFAHCQHLRRSVVVFSANPVHKQALKSSCAAVLVHANSNFFQKNGHGFARGTMVAAGSSSLQQQEELDGVPATDLGYFRDMFALQSKATFLALVQDGDRLAVLVDRTVLYPQGGGQPCDTGYISAAEDNVKFRVEDVRAKNGHVYHYGNFGSSKDTSFQKGQEVLLTVDDSRRVQNSRLHSAGHLLDACMKAIGLHTLEPGKGHHFPDSPFVEYKGTIPASDIEIKRAALEGEANRLVTAGGSVQAVVAPYEEAVDLCDGNLPDYISKESTPRIVTVGGVGCPCGGTHVADISEIGSIKVTQIRVKKGTTKVSYTITTDTK